MPDYIGSYYPLIHFPHDSWIKLAAIYWDKLGRIVPVDYPLHDSDTVQKLQGERVLSPVGFGPSPVGSTCGRCTRERKPDSLDETGTTHAMRWRIHHRVSTSSARASATNMAASIP